MLNIQTLLSLFLYKLHNTPGTKNNKLKAKLGNKAFAESGKINGQRQATIIPAIIAANPASFGTKPLKNTINVNGKNIPAPAMPLTDNSNAKPVNQDNEKRILLRQM